MNWRNYLNKIGYYFRDSYGFDRFSNYLILGGAVLSALRYTAILGYVLVLYGLWRAASKNKAKRYKELTIFENYLGMLKQSYYKYKRSAAEGRQYKVFKCPNCSQKLRVPRKKGKLVITCKKCGTEFKGKS